MVVRRGDSVVRSSINSKKYADGGFVSAMPQSINTGNPMVARVNNTDMITFARIVSQSRYYRNGWGSRRGGTKNKTN